MKVNLKKLQEPPEESSYQATDDDLPSILWTDKEFWEQIQKEIKNESVY